MTEAAMLDAETLDLAWEAEKAFHAGRRTVGLALIEQFFLRLIERDAELAAHFDDDRRQALMRVFAAALDNKGDRIKGGDACANGGSRRTDPVDGAQE
jgi:hypothetical protein